MATSADAEIVLKLYDLRRDPRMRAARNWVMHEFNPGTLEELLAVQRDFGSEHNQFWRQVIGYWEMASAFVLRGVLDEELFFDTNGENVFLVAKFGRFNAEYHQQTGIAFMPKTVELVERHPAARERCAQLRKFLEMRASEA